MKKYLISLIVIFAISMTGCQKDIEPGGTAVQDMAGEWWVTCEVESAPGAGDWSDVGVGHVLFSTYNTAANKSTEMWVNDNKHFWSFRSVVKVDYGAKKFFTTDSVSTNSATSPLEKVFIKDGKVLKGAATTPRGVPGDSIVFYASFNNDTPLTTVYKISGFKRTGFPADDF